MNETRDRLQQSGKKSKQQNRVLKTHSHSNGNGNTKKEQNESKLLPSGDTLRIIFEIISQPILMIGFQILCNERQCSFVSWPDFSRYSTLPDFFDLQSFLYYLGFITVIFLLGSVPIGGKRIRRKDYTYNLNGFSLAMFMVLILIVFEIIGIPASTFISNHIMHFVVSTLIFQVCLGIFLYIFSFTARPDQLNPREIGTSFMSAFYNGRQINPRLFNTIDIKFTYVRIFTTTVILTDVAMVLRSLGLTSEAGLDISKLNWTTISSHPTIIVLAFLRDVYYLCHLYNESRTMNSYFTTSEGMGYNTTMANSFRWSGLLAQTKYIMEHKVHYPTWQLVCILGIFIFAQHVYNETNNQKDDFRSFPDSPKSKKMKRIPTSTGKDILCDGWWGRLRQPNIMADIIIHLTWLRFGITAPPMLSIIGLFYYLLDRAIVSQRDCSMKYGLAWKKYCNKVKYVLLPFVY